MKISFNILKLALVFIVSGKCLKLIREILKLRIVRGVLSSFNSALEKILKCRTKKKLNSSGAEIFGNVK